MKLAKFAFPLVLACLISLGALAGDKDAKSFRGTVTEKPADAKAGVIAVLQEGKHRPKDGQPAAESKKYSLIATGEVANQVKALLGKHVIVTGTETADGVTVTEIKENVRTDGKKGKKDEATK